MEIKKINKRVYGDKLSNLVLLEQLNFNVPAFMYFDEPSIEKKEYKYIEKNDYFKKYLKDDKMVLRASIYDPKKYGKYIFTSLEDVDLENLEKAMDRIHEKFNETLNNVNRIFVPGVIIQKMIPNNYSLELNIVKNKAIIVKEYLKGKKDTSYENIILHYFDSKEDIKSNSINCSNSLLWEIKLIIFKIIEHIEDFNNIYLELVLHENKWWIISFDYNSENDLRE